MTDYYEIPLPVREAIESIQLDMGDADVRIGSISFDGAQMWGFSVTREPGGFEIQTWLIGRSH